MTHAAPEIKDAFEGIAGAPPRLIEGRPNPAFLRWQFRVVSDLATDVALGRAEMPKGFNFSQALDLLKEQARHLGFDPRHLADTRTDAQVFADSVDRILEAPGELFALPDKLLDDMEREMDKADQYARDMLGGSGSDIAAQKISKGIEARALAKKKWARRIERLRRLRDRARSARPAKTANRDVEAHAASRVLRFMVYAGRSSLDGDAGVFQVGRHHAVMAVALHEARTRRRFQEVNGSWEWLNVEKCDGCMLICPPGHGKTSLAVHVVVLMLDDNPRLKGLIGHAQAGEAEKDLAYVASYFRDDTANGRRNRSLFPGLPGIARINSDTFDLSDEGEETKRQPTLKAHGITAKISGADADFIWFDDPCDQELAETETTRQRVFDRMNGTWRARKRGKRAFELTTTTLWHHDDPNARRLEMARTGKIMLRVSRQSCGGPEQSFAPLWPEVYPASMLRQKYAEMRNPRLYAAAYQSNPQPEELRTVKRLRFYDPTEDSHHEFMATAVFYLSVDPAATNTEKADHASFVYAALGDVPGVNADGATTSAKRLRIIDCRKFHATQGEAVDKSRDFAESRRVDYLLWEARSGFKAGPEMLSREFGIDVIQMDPQNRQKGLRLKDAQPYLDDSLSDKGLPHAPVEFPGVFNEQTGKTDPDPELEWYYKQILEFGVSDDDDAVDATTQLVKHVGRDLDTGEGRVTTQAKAGKPVDPRLKERWDRLFNRGQAQENQAEAMYRFCREAI